VLEEFQPIVQTFIAEAALRGRSIEVNNLIIQYDANLEAGVCGRCNSNKLNEQIQKIISINPTKSCWSTSQEKEALFFHELGHCLLGRLHNNDLLPNGDPKSIMVENNRSTYNGCVYQFGEEDDCNILYKREYYLDELFDENTPTPEWAN